MSTLEVGMRSLVVAFLLVPALAIAQQSVDLDLPPLPPLEMEPPPPTPPPAKPVESSPAARPEKEVAPQIVFEPAPAKATPAPQAADSQRIVTAGSASIYDRPPRAVSPPATPTATNDDLYFGSVPFIEAGNGQLGLRFASLAGDAVAAARGAAQIRNGRFSAGIALESGSTVNMSLTTFGVDGGFLAYSWRYLDVVPGVGVAVGAASLAVGDDSTPVLTIEPKISAQVHLLPWVSVQAGLGYRLVNAATWSGPPGDLMSGLGLNFGLVFGSR